MERRGNHFQRAAVERVLPEPGKGSILRRANGEVLIYDEVSDKRRPTVLRAAVLPDGETVEFVTRRFDRAP